MAASLTPRLRPFAAVPVSVTFGMPDNGMQNQSVSGGGSSRSHFRRLRLPAADHAFMHRIIKKHIAFVGGGNMAASLIGGLIADGVSPENLRVSDPDEGALQSLVTRFQVQIAASNDDAARHADTVVFAVKPQVMVAAMRGVAEVLRTTRPLVISIAAGVREPDLRRRPRARRA